jgi:hypothetical protein
VLTLDESGSSTSSNGSFTANGPFMVQWACLGTGTLQVTYGNVSHTTNCTAQPQVQTSGLQMPAPSGQQVSVSAIGQGDTSWEVLVEMQV